MILITIFGWGFIHQLTSLEGPIWMVGKSPAVEIAETSHIRTIAKCAEPAVVFVPKIKVQFEADMGWAGHEPCEIPVF